MTDINDIFVFNNHPGGVRYLDKALNVNERRNYNNWWNEQLHQYGTVVDYYTSMYSLSTHDFIYGEEPTKQYADPSPIIFCLNLNENAAVMKKFGLMADDELTGFIAIDTFYRNLSSADDKLPEPKAGDVFDLLEYGSRDRPGGRKGKWFEITEREEQDISQINPILGHYAWLIKAKRFDYSFEPGLSGERVMDQVYDDKFSGLLPGLGQDKSVDKKYLNDIQDKSKKVFDYDQYEQSNDDVYGGYNPNAGPPY